MKCCDLTSGLLRNKIDIERETTAVDNTGGYSSGWSVVLSVYAAIQPVNGFEKLHSMQLKTNVSHKMYLRYTNNITTKDRIIYDNREFQIRAVINVEERSKWLEIIANEGEVN